MAVELGAKKEKEAQEAGTHACCGEKIRGFVAGWMEGLGRGIGFG